MVGLHDKRATRISTSEILSSDNLQCISVQAREGTVTIYVSTTKGVPWQRAGVSFCSEVARIPEEGVLLATNLSPRVALYLEGSIVRFFFIYECSKIYTLSYCTSLYCIRSLSPADQLESPQLSKRRRVFGWPVQFHGHSYRGLHSQCTVEITTYELTLAAEIGRYIYIFLRDAVLDQPEFMRASRFQDCSDWYRFRPGYVVWS